MGRKQGNLPLECRACVVLQHSLRDAGDFSDGVGGHDQDPLYKIPNFPHVSRPAVGLYLTEHLFRKTFVQVVFATEKVQEIETQGNDVLRAVAHRRNGQGDHTEAVVKIFPKFSILHQGVEILVGGGNQPEIYFFRRHRADALYAFFLDDPKKLALYAHRQGVDLIDKKRASVRRFDQAHLSLLVCSGEAPLLVAKQL